MTTADYIYVALAAIAGGAINAIAGGGSLVTFPTLVAVGLPPVTANITNTVALCPGYLGATISQRRDLAGQGRRAALLLPVAVLGGVGGAFLLLHTDPHAFDIAVPFLLLFAALLVGAQEKIRKLLFRDKHAHSELLTILPVAAAAVYGGYFGAGMGVIVLAALGIVLADSLLRINALKQTVSLFVNVSAAIVFVFSNRIEWTVAGVMFICALAGGVIGGKLSRKLPAKYLRWLIVALGFALSAVYFAKVLRG
jgi:uncharacterized membrane protein YfcA